MLIFEQNQTLFGPSDFNQQLIQLFSHQTDSRDFANAPNDDSVVTKSPSIPSKYQVAHQVAHLQTTFGGFYNSIYDDSLLA